MAGAGERRPTFATELLIALLVDARKPVEAVRIATRGRGDPQLTFQTGVPVPSKSLIAWLIWIGQHDMSVDEAIAAKCFEDETNTREQHTLRTEVARAMGAGRFEEEWVDAICLACDMPVSLQGRLKGALVRPGPADVEALVRVVQDQLQHLPGARSSRPERRSVALIGRDDDVARALAQIEPGRVVTVVGPPGCGKSALATVTARKYAEANRMNFHWLSWESASPGGLVDLLLQELGIAASPQVSAMDRALAHLRKRPVLLVADACEDHLLEAGEILRRLVTECAAVAVLATSQERLGIQAEATLPLQPLPAPPPGGPTVPVRDFPAVQLLLKRAVEAVPSLDVATLEDADLADICRWLDGLPLALELCAQWLGTIPTEQIIEELRAGPKLLVARDRRPARHRSLETAVEMSLSRITPLERRMLNALSLFPSGATPGDVIKVAGADVAREAAYEALRRLVSRNLLPPLAGDRFDMFRFIRDYLRDQLRETEAEGQLRRRFRQLFVGKARDIEPTSRGVDQAEVLSAVDADLENYRAAIRDAIASNAAEAGYWIVGSLWRYWRVRSMTQEVLRNIDELGKLPQAESAARARALAGAGNLAYWAGRYELARNLLKQALSDGEAVGDREWSIPFAQLISGIVMVVTGENRTDARRRLEASLKRWEELGDATGQYLAHYWLGEVDLQEDDLSAANDHEDRCVTVIEPHSDVWAKSQYLRDLASRAERTGDPRGIAANRYRASLQFMRQINDRSGAASCLLGIARLQRQTDPEDGLTALLEAVRTLRGAQNAPVIAAALEAGARYLDDAGRYGDAVLFARVSIEFVSRDAGQLRGVKEQELMSQVRGFSERSRQVTSIHMEAVSLARDAEKALDRLEKELVDLEGTW